MVLLAALLTSSCYWQPLPLDAPLTVPFNGSSTFGEALAAANLSLSEPVDVPTPQTVKLLDRCWCSLQNGRFFEPFDVSKWERWSVDWTLRELKAKKDKEREEELLMATSGAEQQAGGFYDAQNDFYASSGCPCEANWGGSCNCRTGIVQSRSVACQNC